jgi:hypothetical protein
MMNYWHKQLKLALNPYTDGKNIHIKLYIIIDYLLEPAVGPCLYELASGPGRKVQGTGAKVSDQTIPV